MNESSIRLGPREQQIAELLLQGCDNSEIARQLKMARRTVKAHFNRLFYALQLLAVSSESNSQLFFIGGNYVRRTALRKPDPSEREQRVIELVAQGLKNREVADAIGTTEHVVKNYLRIIYDKLGLWNRVELALWYEAPTANPGARLRFWKAGSRIFSVSINPALAAITCSGEPDLIRNHGKLKDPRSARVFII